MATYDGHPFIPAKWKMTGRAGYSIIWGVVHTTETREGYGGAEATARHAQRRTDPVSFHSVIDADSVVRCVRDNDTAYAALNPGNLRGLHQEIVGTARQTKAQWADDISRKTLALAARDMANWCRKHDIPPRWCTDAQLRNRAKGLTTHNQLARVFTGTHWDPGPNFPFDSYLAAVKRHLDPEMEDDMAFGEKQEKQLQRLDRWMSQLMEGGRFMDDAGRSIDQSIKQIHQQVDANAAALAGLIEGQQETNRLLNEILQAQPTPGGR